MQRVLVVWNMVPEEAVFVSLPNVDEATANKMRTWHNQFVNCVDTPADMQKEIDEFFFDGEGNFKYEKIKTPLVGQVFDLIIQTGFFL
jgi:hypothetical protein